ncbi:hypothetical protein AB6846_05835 [Serratia proteamaculans]
MTKLVVMAELDLSLFPLSTRGTAAGIHGRRPALYGILTQLQGYGRMCRLSSAARLGK